MKPRTIAMLGAVTLTTSIFITPASGAPGDALLVQGTLEWPATLTSEPMVIVRGDDGKTYYASVVSAQRHVTGQLTAGTRIALIGVEGGRPQAMNVVALGNADVAALALELSKGTTPSSAVAASPATGTPAAATLAPAPVPAAAPAAPAVVAIVPGVPATPSRGPAPASTASIAPAPMPTPLAVDPRTLASIAPPSAPAASAPTAAAPPAPAAPTPYVAVASAAPNASVWPSESPDARRWIEVQGVVQSVNGRSVVLKGDDGQVISVDASSLSPNFPDMVRPGAYVSVFGIPIAQKFKAMGFVDSNRPGLGPSSATPKR